MKIKLMIDIYVALIMSRKPPISFTVLSKVTIIFELFTLNINPPRLIFYCTINSYKI